MSVSTTTIENLPIELIEVIFNQLNLNDIGNCVRASKRWQSLISEVYKNKARILITSGMPKENGQNTEIIDLINPDFECELLANIPARSAAVGGFLQNHPFICGGKDDAWNCFQDGIIFGRPFGTTCQSIQMMEKRAQASSVEINATKVLNSSFWNFPNPPICKSFLWVVGGSGGYLNTSNDKTSTEFISIDLPPIRGPYLPFTITDHCMIQYDSNSIYIIGGFQNGTISGKTWIVNPCDNFVMKEGPSLNVERSFHSCGKMKLNGKKTVIVVAGGTRFDECLDSVEILDPKSKQGWMKGPNFKLPSQIEKASMVTSPNGRGVVLIGGSLMGFMFSKSMLELWGNSLETLKWIPLNHTLQFARRHHVAFLIPDDFANFSSTGLPEIQLQEKYFPKSIISEKNNYNNISSDEKEQLIRNNSKKKCILS